MFSSDERGGAREAVYGQPEPALQYVDFSPQSGRVTGIDVRSLPTNVLTQTRPRP